MDIPLVATNHGSSNECKKAVKARQNAMNP